MQKQRRTLMNKKLEQYRTLEEVMVENFRNNPKELEAYLAVALEEYEADHDTKAFLLSLRIAAEVTGGMTNLARRTHLNREHLYRALSSKGNPRFSTVDAILHALGFGLVLKPISSF